MVAMANRSRGSIRGLIPWSRGSIRKMQKQPPAQLGGRAGEPPCNGWCSKTPGRECGSHGRMRRYSARTSGRPKAMSSAACSHVIGRTGTMIGTMIGTMQRVAALSSLDSSTCSTLAGENTCGSVKGPQGE